MNKEIIRSIIKTYHVFVVLAAVGLGMVSARFLPATIIVILGVFALHWWAEGHPPWGTPVDLPVLVLGGMALVSLWISPLPEKTMPQVLRLFSGIALMYAVSGWVDSRTRLRWLAWEVLLAGSSLAVASLWMVEWTDSKITLIPQGVYHLFQPVVSDTVHPNVLAGSLVIFLAFALGWLLFEGLSMSLITRLGVGMAVIVMGSVLVFSQSRSAILGVGVTVVVLSILAWRYWALFWLAAVGAAWFFIQQYGAARLMSQLFRVSSQGGAAGRTEIWQRALLLIRDFPLTGVGLGLYEDAAWLLYPFEPGTKREIAHAHNLYLQIAVDLGIPGFLAWFGILLFMVFAAWRIFRAGKSGSSAWLAGIGAGFLGGLLAMAVHGLLDAVVWGMLRSAPIIWGFWGVILGAYCWLDREGRARPGE